MLKGLKIKRVFLLAFGLIVGLGVLSGVHAGFVLASGHEATWWPIAVKSYYGPYIAADKKPGQASPSLKRPKLEEWAPPLHKTEPYVLGVSFPHLKDSYWVSVNYGIMEEASRLGIGIKLVEAGGYDNLDTQNSQILSLLDQGVDGIILGAVSYTGNDKVIAESEARGVPVVEVVNDVYAPEVSAKAMVSFYEMGYLSGEFLVEYAERKGLSNIRVAFFPGPQISGWAPESLVGFRAAMEYFPGMVDLSCVKWGDTGAEVQSRLIRECLAEGPVPDYIVGNAVAAEAAVPILREKGLTDSCTIISTYMIPSLFDKIQNSSVAGAPADLAVFQARMAVDMMVRLLDGEKPGEDFPFRSGPFIPMVTPENVESYPYEGLFGPKDYKPVMELESSTTR